MAPKYGAEGPVLLDLATWSLPCKGGLEAKGGSQNALGSYRLNDSDKMVI